jgi:hypothetical protein
MEKDTSMNPLHPEEISLWRRRLKKWRLSTIISKLKAEGLDVTLIELKQDAIDIYVDKVIVPLYFDRRK